MAKHITGRDNECLHGMQPSDIKKDKCELIFEKLYNEANQWKIPCESIRKIMSAKQL